MADQANPSKPTAGWTGAGDAQGGSAPGDDSGSEGAGSGQSPVPPPDKGSEQPGANRGGDKQPEPGPGKRLAVDKPG